VTDLAETVQQIKEREHQEDLARLRGLRPIDDDFMRCIFRDNIPLAQMVLRIVTGISDLKIIRLETQKDMKRLVGARSICLDAYGCDSSGRKYDLEIQRADHGAGKCRARYHSSSMDVENLDAGQEFEELPTTYIIFITENDIWRAGKAIYPIRKTVEGAGADGAGQGFADRQHILYVNASYMGDDPIGVLMHDFLCSDPDEMKTELLADKARYLKTNPEGVKQMCKVMEDLREESIQRGIDQNRIESIKNVMESFKVTAQQAMDALKIPTVDQSKYMAKL
jgi:hypothetical protein